MAVPAAPTLAVTVDWEREAARLELGVPADATSLNVWRVSPSGAVAGVRGAYPAAVTGGATLVLRDYEVPLNTPVSYYATAANTEGTGPEMGPVAFTVATQDECKGWIVDTVRPSNSGQHTIVSLDTLEYPITAGVHRVLERRDPVISTSLAGTPNLELVVLAETLLEADHITLTVGNGLPILLRTVPEWGIGNMWLYPVAWTTGRLSSEGVDPKRIFTLGCVQIERPDPALYAPMPPTPYAAVTATYATYAALLAARPTYDAVLYDYAIGEAPPVLPFPPVDV
jgi:hypothetical protein